MANQNDQATVVEVSTDENESEAESEEEFELSEKESNDFYTKFLRPMQTQR